MAGSSEDVGLDLPRWHLPRLQEIKELAAFAHQLGLSMDDEPEAEAEEEEEEEDELIDDDAGNDLPPRLVTFLYLQDCPTLAHGPTAFLPGTADAEAHLLNEFDEEALVEFHGPAEVATVDAGDAVIYDASVLHFATANVVPKNDRVVFYCSFALPGAAAAAYVPPPSLPDGMVAAAPLPLSSLGNPT